MSILLSMILSILLSDQFILLRVPEFDLLGILIIGQKSVGNPEENGTTFSD